MSVARKIHFNALPEAVRQRFADRTTGREQPAPLCSQPLTTSPVLFGFLALLGAGGLWAAYSYGFGDPWSSDAVQQPLWLIAYALGGFVLFRSILAIVRRASLRKALPFRPGRYLFALDLVDAEGEVLTLWPMSQCVDFQGTHHHTNGVYTHTSLTFVFKGGHKQSFSIRGKQAAEEVLQGLGAVQSAVSDAVGRIRSGQGTEQDVGLIFAYDPFFEARMSDEWASLSEKPPHHPGQQAAARPQPGYLKQATALAAVAAVLLGLPVWIVRNQLSDAAMWSFAQGTEGAWAVEAYLRNGRAHLDEARALLVQRKFEEARTAGTVTAMRHFLDEFPDHAEAKQALHALYEQALAAFAAQASTGDPKLVPFVKALIGNLEASQSTRVDVRFFRPTEALLEDIDKQVAERGGTIEGVQVAPVAPHFSKATAEQRERTILASLQQGFGTVFPEDIMELEYVTMSGDADAQPEITRPTIDLVYMVAPSGSLYSGEKRDRAFIGIQVNFDVEMHVPRHPDTISFELTVEPPSEFIVESSYLAFAGVPAEGDGPADDLVYTVMAARAFDHLSQKLRLALFRSDSEAFRRAEEALRAAGAAAQAGAAGAPAGGAEAAPADEPLAPPQ
jgi:hypothetical protein